MPSEQVADTEGAKKKVKINHHKQTTIEQQ